MNLSVREQQALDFMAEGLADSAPKLASLLATFARLTSGEQMPVHEKIRLARRRETHGAHRLYQCLGFHPAALLWLLITVAMVAVALVIGDSGSQGGCATSWAVICTGPAPAHSSRPAAHKTAADLALRATSMRHATSAALRSTGGSQAAAIWHSRSAASGAGASAGGTRLALRVAVRRGGAVRAPVRRSR